MRVLCCCLCLAAVVAAQGATQLSEEERLRVALYQTQIQLEQTLADAAQCRLQLRGPQLQQQGQELKQSIEKAHPGYVLSPMGQLTPQEK